MIAPDILKGQCCIRDLQTGDIGWIIHRQALLYAREYGWNIEFEGFIAGILSDFIRGYDAACERAWIAEFNRRIVGSIFLVKGDDPGTAKLRFLYVDQDARGHGIGQRLIAQCVQSARDLGYERLDLWTNSGLAAARHLYGRAGFQLVREEAHHSFGHDLVGQYWSLDLGQT